MLDQGMTSCGGYLPPELEAAAELDCDAAPASSQLPSLLRTDTNSLYQALPPAQQQPSPTITPCLSSFNSRHSFLPSSNLSFMGSVTLSAVLSSQLDVKQC